MQALVHCCADRETGCEEGKELVTNSCNCFAMLHSKGSGFGETWSGSCTSNFSANVELVSFVISLHAIVLMFFSYSSGTGQIMTCRSDAHCPGGCKQLCACSAGQNIERILGSMGALFLPLTL